MEVQIDSELTMDGSEGCGGLSTRDRYYQKWVSLPQKGKDVDGDHISSRNKAISSSSLTKKGPFCTSGVDVNVDDDVTGKTSMPFRSTNNCMDVGVAVNGSDVVAVDTEVVANEDRSTFDLPLGLQCSQLQFLDSVSYDLSNRSGHRGASSGVRISEDDISADAIKNTADQDVVGVVGNNTDQITFFGDSPSDVKGNTPMKVNRSLLNAASYCTAGATATSGTDGIGAFSAAAHVNDVTISATATIGYASVLDSATTTATLHVDSFLGLSSGDFPPLPVKGVLGIHKGASKAVTPPRETSARQCTFTNRVCNANSGANCPNVQGVALVEGMGIWEGCLVGQFFDKRLPVHVVRSLVERLWGKHEIPEISTTDNGLYIFRFTDRDARDWVLENGPWYFVRRPIILRIWKPSMEMLNVQITSLPIWVMFFNIPLEYWTVTSLGYIASAVGIPLHLDTLTDNHSILSFARICIEVDVNCTFPKSALLDLGNGKYSTIRIEYPWVPQNFSHCKIFGHSRLKFQFVKVKVDSGRSTCLANGYVNADVSSSRNDPVNVDADIVNHITTLAQAGKDTVADIPTRLTGNTFECLAICEDSGTLKVDVEHGPPDMGLQLHRLF